ncbi:MAG: manganese efflux pump MntP [Candidatus Caldatribacteriaceae bacterium]
MFHSGVEIFLVAISLGLDAFSVAVAFGMCRTACLLDEKMRLSLSFGLFQFFMPLVGFYFGTKVNILFDAFDHWVVLIILGLLGTKMIRESFSREQNDLPDVSRGIPLFLASLATSLDALAVGFSFALLERKIFLPALFIGIVASTMTYLGVSLGHRLRREITTKPELIGGIALWFVGIKIFLENL